MNGRLTFEIQPSVSQSPGSTSSSRAANRSSGSPTTLDSLPLDDVHPVQPILVAERPGLTDPRFRLEVRLQLVVRQRIHHQPRHDDITPGLVVGAVHRGKSRCRHDECGRA